MASFFPTADVANSRFDNDLSEDLIRGPPLWIRRVLVRSQEGQLEARCDIESCRASTILDSLVLVGEFCSSDRSNSKRHKMFRRWPVGGLRGHRQRSSGQIRASPAARVVWQPVDEQSRGWTWDHGPVEYRNLTITPAR